MTHPKYASIIILADAAGLQQHDICDRGGTGRRARLRGVWETVWVQVPSIAPTKKQSIYIDCFFAIVIFSPLEIVTIYSPV